MSGEAPLPITGADYLHLPTGERYRVEAVVGPGVWVRGRGDRRHFIPTALFPRSFVPMEAAEGLLIVLGVIQVEDLPVPYTLAEPQAPEPAPVHGPAVNACVERFREHLTDDALAEWLQPWGGEPA
jgi:hypothetical protein